MSNTTQSYLYARAPLSTLCFSGALTTASVGLPGPGGQSGSGFPMPRRGYVTALHLWDGVTLRSDITELAFQAGDRLSIYCQNVSGSFTVKLRLNGSASALQVEDVPLNSTLYATVEILLFRD